ncbi:MAG: hypothetical protein Q9168_006403 [Polycauliona sp. 1 TL-2023]
MLPWEDHSPRHRRHRVLSVDYPVPSAIQNAVQSKYWDDPATNGTELRYMRYTAVTCDPDNFAPINGYNLRPSIYNRHTELLIGVTYYNESKVMLSKTLHAIKENIRDIVNLKSAEFWHTGDPAWQKIVVCVICDGIDFCDLEILDVLATTGLYQDGIMRKTVDGNETVAHVFEYTTQLSVTKTQQIILPLDDGPSTIPPVQMILCLKKRNSQKFNSHRWLFGAFGRILKPEIVISIDAGTKPGKNSILALWEAFFNDKSLGGASGEIRATLGWDWKTLGNVFVAAQNFEYKVNSMLDKPLEAVFGYLTVLPGAFSAYRYRAVVGRPLQRYFYGDRVLAEQLDTNGLKALGIFQRNLYMAEDRILCYELVMKKDSVAWHLGYVKSAKAETDIPDNMADFITQRRRWLNGTFASTIYSLIYFFRIYQSAHGVVRTTLFHVQLIYNVVALTLSWFGLAAFLLTTFIITDISGSSSADQKSRAFPFGTATPTFNAILQCVYISFVIFQFILALGNKVRSERLSYIISFMVFAFIQVYFIMNVVFLVVRLFLDNDSSSNGYAYIATFYSSIGSLTVWVTCGSIFGVYYAVAILHLDPWHMITSYPQYLLIASAYTNILNVYAFSNWHDVSWGTKGKHEDLAFASLSSSDAGNARQKTKPTLLSDHPNGLDVDQHFEIVVKRALTTYVKPAETKQVPTLEESSKTFRTKLVAVYIFSNFMLCIFVMNESFDKLSFLVSCFPRSNSSQEYLMYIFPQTIRATG